MLSIQQTIVSILLKKLSTACKKYHITEIALAGGVSANSELRQRFEELGKANKWVTHIPKFEYCTDNAGMIALAAYHKFLRNEFCDQSTEPLARYALSSQLIVHSCQLS